MQYSTQTIQFVTWFRVGMFIGPYVTAAIYLICWAALDWIRSPLIGFGLVVTTLGSGILCFVFYKQPAGMQWLLLIPYLFTHAVLATIFVIAFALILGAPK